MFVNKLEGGVLDEFLRCRSWLCWSVVVEVIVRTRSSVGAEGICAS